MSASVGGIYFLRPAKHKYSGATGRHGILITSVPSPLSFGTLLTASTEYVVTSKPAGLLRHRQVYWETIIPISRLASSFAIVEQ